MVRTVQLTVLAALVSGGTAVQQFEHKRATVRRHHKGERRGSQTPLGADLVVPERFDAEELQAKLLASLHQEAEKDQTTQTQQENQADGGAADLLERRREQAEFRARVRGHTADPKMEACRGKEQCKLPMCRWLELSRNDEAGRCPIFEKELMACARWKPVEAREDSSPQKVDCAVDILRRTDVVAKRVQSNVDELEQCMSTLDGLFPDTRCDVAFGLVFDAIADYKYRAVLEANLTEVRAEIRQEIPIARAALSEQGQNAGEVAETLQRIVSKAEAMPGAMMVGEIDTANDLLRQLVPIPAARRQLQRGLELSEAAFDHGDLHSVEESIAQLELATEDGERFHVGEPLATAQQTLERLRTLRASMQDLEDADFSANVSLVARTDVDASIQRLEQSIARSEASGLQAPGLLPARSLLKQLTDVRDALREVERANGLAVAALAEEGDKGMKNIHTVFKALNNSINNALALGLGAKPPVTDAVGNLDNVRWLYSARRALHHANHLGQEVLSSDGRNVSDDREEEIMSYITPALEWANEMHLRNGLGEAQRLYDLLSKEEVAKENMSTALAQANASLGAHASVDFAIRVLEAATAQEAQVRDQRAARGKEATLVAGAALAEDMLRKLKELQHSRDALHDAEVGLNESLRSGVGVHKAGNFLNQSIRRAQEDGFDAEATVATQKLVDFKAYLAAKERLLESLKKEAARRPEVSAEVRDTEAERKLVRTGLEPKDLGPVQGAEDDYDDDFDEHVNALQSAIEAARKDGYVDPKQQAALARAIAMRSAHEELLKAMEVGREAFGSKAKVQDAIVALTGALADVNNFGIRDDVYDAQSVLRKLEPIEPARAELARAMLQATIAFRTETELGDAWQRLTAAIARSKELNVTERVAPAEELLQQVMVKKEAAVNLKAAMIHGDIALKTKTEEELAMQELETSLAQARAANLTRRLPEAESMLEELLHMHLGEETLEETMHPHGENFDSD